VHPELAVEAGGIEQGDPPGQLRPGHATDVGVHEYGVGNPAQRQVIALSGDDAVDVLTGSNGFTLVARDARRIERGIDRRIT
jgi:hypothetical protein